MFRLMSILTMRSCCIHLNSNFHGRNLLDFINGTSKKITRRNVTLGGQSLRRLLIKSTWEQEKNQAGNIKAIFQGTEINLKLFFIVLLSVILGKCSSLIRNLVLRIFDSGVLKYL